MNKIGFIKNIEIEIWSSYEKISAKIIRFLKSTLMLKRPRHIRSAPKTMVLSEFFGVAPQCHTGDEGYGTLKTPRNYDSLGNFGPIAISKSCLKSFQQIKGLLPSTDIEQ